MWQEPCFDGGLRGTPPKGNKRSFVRHELRKIVWVMKKQSGVTIVECAWILALFVIVAVVVLTALPPIEPEKTPPLLVTKKVPLPSAAEKIPLPDGGKEKCATVPPPLAGC